MKPMGGVLVLALWLLAACGPAPTAPRDRRHRRRRRAAGGAAPPRPRAPPRRRRRVPLPKRRRRPGAPLTVRMGVLGILAESGVYIALERGYFAEEGIAPEFTTIGTGARAVPAMATGQWT